ncbi:MAG: NosD domain-containing protein [Candidatus Limnocylindria bacterium]
MRMAPGRAYLLVLLLVASAACQAARPAAQPSPTPAAPTTAPPSPSPSASPSPAVPPQSAECGRRIDADFTLANDLTCEGDALVIVADGVTLDLGGRTITGPGMGPQTWPRPQLDSVGVRAGGHTGVTVRNGSIAGFSTGVYFVDMTGSVIENVRSERSRYGFYLDGGTGNTVRGSAVSLNIYGLHLQSSNGNVIEGNQLSRQTYNSPGGYGIYLYNSMENRIVGNAIEDNVNWGIWFSAARGNVIYHNNVVGNRPQVSDSTTDNVWYDEATKQGNYWGDYEGTDGDGDLIGDTPYEILGAGGTVDPYPFVQRDGWQRKSVPTVDHYRPPAASAPRQVRLVALSDGGVYTAAPAADRATLAIHGGTSVALGSDGRTLYVLDGRTLAAYDLVTGGETARRHVTVADGIVAANRDGVSVLVVGPDGAEQLRLDDPSRHEYFAYRSRPERIAPSYKHNHIFVSNPRGIDLLYLNLGGRTPYTIPLSGEPGAIAMAESGTRIYAVAKGTGGVDVVDTEKYRVVTRVALGVEGTALAVAPDESTLYVGTADGLLAVDLHGHAVRARTPLPGRAVDAAASPNGDEVYVAIEGERTGIAVLRASDLAILRVIGLDAPPLRLLVASY